MSHVDEGLLHALLDGGLEGTAELAEVEDHLSTCAECRQRLAEVTWEPDDGIKLATSNPLLRNDRQLRIGLVANRSGRHIQFEKRSLVVRTELGREMVDVQQRGRVRQGLAAQHPDS